MYERRLSHPVFSDDISRVIACEKSYLRFFFSSILVVLLNLMSETSKKRGRRESDFVCKVKYKNTLPEIPFDVKTLKYDVDLSQYVPYSHTSLMKNHVWEYYPETSFPLDLVDIEAWNPDPGNDRFLFFFLSISL
jgi:predicted naringenin-chalcone synthase